MANLRQTVFSGRSERLLYVAMLQKQIYRLLCLAESCLVFNNADVFKSFIMIPINLQQNFQIRDLMAANEQDLQAYIFQLLTFTLICFKASALNSEIHTNANKLCLMWQRISLELHINEVQFKNEVEQRFSYLIDYQLDAFLKVPFIQNADNSECFDSRERTTRNDDID